MSLRFVALELPRETATLLQFLTSEEWPFHGNTRLLPEKAAKMIQDGLFEGSNNRTFWIHDNAGEKIGLIRLFDLDDIEDGVPLFDLRLKARARGKGHGKVALQWLTDYFFETWPELDRVEGNTRSDNSAMKKLFRSCHYAKEGHFRRAWRNANGTALDSIHFAILRDDWKNKKVTPVPWDQE